MDPERIHAYLQAACAGLGMTIGEVWFAQNETGTSTVAKIESVVMADGTNQPNADTKARNERDIKFLQLYTSKSYKNRRNDLLRPESGDGTDSKENKGKSSKTEIQKHVLSPKLVNAIASTAQVVWANCEEREGLLGRSDMRLLTAVGMPVAMDAEGNMCIVVMFSPKNVPSNTDAVEYLKCLSEGATSTSIPCLLPVMDSGTKKLEYNPKRFSDWEEHEENIQKEKKRDGKTDADELQLDFSNHLFGIPLLPLFGDADSGGNRRNDGGSLSGSDDDAAAFDQASYGLWSTIMENPEINSAIEQIPDETTSLAAAISAAQSETPTLHPERKERLEEFSSAFLSMSVFDVADFWMPSTSADGVHNLHHVFSLSSDDNNTSLNYFKIGSKNTRIQGWAGAVGRAFCSGSPVWSNNTETIVDAGRAEAFAIANICTSLAVPIFSSGSVSPSCVLCFYSMVRSDCVPFVLKFVQQALRSLWLGLESLQPHESIGKDLWKDVAPADLGEMAADLEMQKAFYQKKRPYDAITSKHENAYSNFHQGSTQGTDSRSALAAQLQSLHTPSGHASTVINEDGIISTKQQHQSAEQTAQTIQSAMHDAIKLVADVRPTQYSSGGNAAKRINIGSTRTTEASTLYLPQSHSPPQPHQFPTINPYDSKPRVLNQMNAVEDQPFVPGIPQHQQIQIQPQPLRQPQLLAQSQYLPQAVISQNENLANSVTTNEIVATLPPVPTPTLASTPALHDKSKPNSKVCRIQGCNQISAARRPYCTKHSANRKCEHEGCTKCAQGATRFCIGHGGGRRCTFPNCDKGARDKFFCAAHGGGKRCNAPGCKKSAVGGSHLCTSHGGGRRCAVDGCEKSAQSSTKFCVKHGGGKKCCHPCCEKVARGKTQYCAGHGGGVRCKLEGCTRIAIGKMQLCRAHGGGSKQPTKPVSS